MKDNASKDWSSWNIKNDAQRDVRHHEPQPQDDLQAQWHDYALVKLFEQLQAENPEVAQKILDNSPDAAQALSRHTDSRGARLRKTFDARKAPKRGNWSDVNRRVKDLLDGR